MTKKIAGAVLAAAMFANAAHGADFKCAGSDSAKDGCLFLAISGRIETGDAARLERYLAEYPDLARLWLHSEGGNVGEAIKIGRMARSNFLMVWATEETHKSCGISTNKPCCMSACALIYYGGAQWVAGDLLGLHRPRLQDIGGAAYEKVHASLGEAKEAIRRYLEEMDAPASAFDLMMNTPPERMAVQSAMPNYRYGKDPSTIYPARIGDWLAAKCRSCDPFQVGSTPRPVPPGKQRFCMATSPENQDKWERCINAVFEHEQWRRRSAWVEKAEELRREQERGPPLSPEQKEKLREAYERLMEEGKIPRPELPPEVLEKAKETKEAKEMRPPTRLEPPPTLDCKTDSDLRAVFPAICP